MRGLALLAAVAAIFYGFRVMRRLDAYLAGNGASEQGAARCSAPCHMRAQPQYYTIVPRSDLALRPFFERETIVIWREKA